MEFYWSLLTKLRRSLEAPLFCVIDGLDECIRQHRPRRQATVDQQMVRFLSQLGAISKERKRGGESCTTKVILTTRFEQEVVSATREIGVLLEILSSDICGSVKQVVAKAVSSLVKGRSVSTTDQEFIIQETITTCGPVFQKGLTAVKILAETRSLDLTDREAVKVTLGNFNFDKYNDVFARVLERIQPPDQTLAAKIIRILYFTRTYMNMDKLQHALAVDKENPTVKDLERPLSKNSISHFIRSSLETLVSMGGPGDTLDLEHQSIYDFFRTLPHTKLHMFSCKNTKKGHLHLALICIRHLTLWRHQKSSEADLVAADGDEVRAVFNNSRLVVYASKTWHIHVRKAGELIKPYRALVDILLGL
jgi:hypothetical protein